jgi:phage/plasmid primase-like uncharacterized protein
MKELELDAGAAIEKLGQQLNIIHDDSALVSAKHKPEKIRPTKQESPKITSKEAKQDKLDNKKINYAIALYNKAKPINGTLAEKYLAKRGIKQAPADFRFFTKLKHPDLRRMFPALIAPIKDGKQQIQGIVRIFLNPDGSKLNKCYADQNGNQKPAISKANLGITKHGAVVVNLGKHNSSTMYIAEGIETALSIRQGTPDSRVLASLSVNNLSKIPIPDLVKHIVLCADQDGFLANSTKTLLDTANHYRARGFKVSIAFPEKIPGMEKADFNDALKLLGQSSVSKSLEQAINVTKEVSCLSELTQEEQQNTTKEVIK